MAKSNSFVVLTDVRLVRDAEKRQAGDRELLSFDIADNPGNDKDETIFVRTTVSGKLAEVLSDLKKGDRVNIVGKMTYRTFEKKDGTTGVSFQVDWPMSVTRVYTDQLSSVPETKKEEMVEKKKPGRPAKAKTKAPWEDDDSDD